MSNKENPNTILKENPFPLTKTQAPRSEINKAYKSRTVPAEPAPFVSKKAPEMNPLSFQTRGIDGKRKG